MSQTPTTADNHRTEAPHSAPLAEDAVVRKATDKVRTPGWKLFDFIAHWVVGWGLNIALALLTVHDQWNYLRNKAIDEGKHTGEKRNVAIPWFHRATEWVDVKSDRLWSAALPGKGNPNDIFKRTRKQAQEITTGFFTLTFGGHFTTLMSQIFEQPKIKRKLVRYLDTHVADPVRRIFGKGPTAEEMEERQEIYHKLDTKLSGKSAVGMWGSRAAGIAMVIGSTILLGSADRALIKNKPGMSEADLAKDEGNRGFGRVPQAFFAASRWLNKKTDGRFNPKYLQPAAAGAFTLGALNYFPFMTRMTALEIAGSTTTAFTQYMYLMAREFFGKGPKTNIGETGKGRKKLEKQTQGTEQAAPETEEQPAAARATKTASHAAKEQKKDSYETAVRDGHLAREATLGAGVVV